MQKNKMEENIPRAKMIVLTYGVKRVKIGITGRNAELRDGGIPR